MTPISGACYNENDRVASPESISINIFTKVLEINGQLTFVITIWTDNFGTTSFIKLLQRGMGNAEMTLI